MAEGDHNPSFDGVWTDGTGLLWRRKGKRERVLEDRRVRSLLRRHDVALVVWWAFETTLYDDPVAKAAAADELIASAGRSDDVHASEWQTEDGRLLLMLERYC